MARHRVYKGFLIVHRGGYIRIIRKGETAMRLFNSLPEAKEFIDREA